MREVHLKLLQLITAVIIFFLLGTHLMMMHFGGGEPTAWNSVAERANSLGWRVFYGFLLAAVIYHGFFGLRTVIAELSLPAPTIKVLSWFLLLIGIGIFAYAISIPISG